MLYRRYVDDTFCLFNNEEYALLFFDYIKRYRYPTIRFSMEREIDTKLSFLDILLDNSHPSIVTSVCSKKKFTDLVANYYF